jgi:N-acetylneuraminate synthase
MEIPYTWLAELKDYCDKKNIIFLCTPFDEQSVDELEKINVMAYKIASYSISHIPLLDYIAKKGKPVILSTGASDIDDIQNAVDSIRKNGNEKIALMQCTAKYPAPLSTINLKVIPKLIESFHVPIGLSDHSREPCIAPLGAVALGASIIEKHFTTDNLLPGPDHAFAILPDELKEMVVAIRKLEEALGRELKVVQQGEKELYKFARRYIYAIKDIEEGEVLNNKNIAVLRSGKQQKGLEPKYFTILLGKKTARRIEKGEPIREEKISGRLQNIS